ncbi:translation initiation factor IF-2-like isoform X2 [Lagopus muta]|uniref:translation initiation factor IF-2-like isoform X2 n=1 Tax=Lagopus muta TaxID=64668 RepID=UPI00209E6601|nr:translation initiation factor IF-2-like isoform X2 [Lagopus muta]
MYTYPTPSVFSGPPLPRQCSCIYPGAGASSPACTGSPQPPCSAPVRGPRVTLPRPDRAPEPRQRRAQVNRAGSRPTGDQGPRRRGARVRRANPARSAFSFVFFRFLSFLSPVTSGQRPNGAPTPPCRRVKHRASGRCPPSRSTSRVPPGPELPLGPTERTGLGSTPRRGGGEPGVRRAAPGEGWPFPRGSALIYVRTAALRGRPRTAGPLAGTGTAAGGRYQRCPAALGSAPPATCRLPARGPRTELRPREAPRRGGTERPRLQRPALGGTRCPWHTRLGVALARSLPGQRMALFQRDAFPAVTLPLLFRMKCIL